MKILKKFKISIALLAISSAFISQPALAYDVTPLSMFTSFRTQDYEVFKNNVISQLSNDYNNLQKAFQQLGKDMHDYIQEASVLGKTATNEFNVIINGLNTASVPTQLSNSSALSGLVVNDIIKNAQNAPGRIYQKDITDDMVEFKNVHNPTEAIVMSSLINLRNRIKDSNNVVSYLDTTAKDYTCKSSGYRCTTLLALQEKVATQVDSLQKATVDRGSYWLSFSRRSHPEDIQYGNIFYTGVQDTVDINQDPGKLSAFLSPAPMLPAGFEPDTTKGALTPQRATVLSDVLLGINNFASLENFQKNEIDSNRALLQSKIMTKFARIQLARYAISSVTSLDVTNAMNSEFKMCVVRPTQEDTVGSSTEQHLTNVRASITLHELKLAASTPRTDGTVEIDWCLTCNAARPNDLYNVK